MKLIYLTVATIPNKTAHSKYVMKLCEGFANQGVDTVIVSGKSFSDKTELNLKNTRLIVKENKYKSLILACFHFLFILKRKIFFQSKDDIYIVHNAMSALACSIIRVNYIVDMHAKIFNNKKAKKILFKHLPLFWIVQSNLLKNFVKNEICIDEKKIFLSRNAVGRVKKYKKIENFVENDDGIKFGYIGRLNPDTGFNEIIEAIDTINYNYTIYVGGNYELYKEYYKKLFKKYKNAKGKIVFLGYLDDSQINYLSKNVDLLMALYSSKIDIFGALSPMKIFEYLRFNKRLLAPEIDDIKEIIEYYNCEDRMRWYEIDNVESLRSIINQVIDEKKDISFNSIQVETWDEKAISILNFANMELSIEN